METSDVRRGLRQALDQAKKTTAERRARADAAAVDYDKFLRQTAIPVFRLLAGIAKAEGLPFTVFTPTDTVRLASERHGDEFMEIWLDTSLDPPVVATRVSRTRGRHVTTSEALLPPHGPISDITGEDVLAFLLAQIGTLVER